MEKIFVRGLRVYKPNENAPEFVKLNFQAFVDDFVQFLQENKDSNGQVRFDMKKSKGGALYLELNTYKKEKVEDVNEELRQLNETQDEQY